ncbi:FAD-binding oxidoreductase [Micromonospora sp. PLK6-60]|uniref:FAD-binding oxidoreductase n=1 Tax=Micromonospora sp. PLK6-60 TaxID=2873383 RepID=UPI001CA7A688|nr:FAD-binding oxidoreductase [Micromonospora sp. PLK6-60]MBY8871977.1 FAD-binding oxidoreductase [Micromonospora sp. PLK6-60]
MAAAASSTGAMEITRKLTEICGPPFARFAGAADEVAGRSARWVAVPGAPAAAAEVLRLAARHDLTVVPRGAGTKIDWGAAPARVDIMLDTGRLAGLGHQSTGSPVTEIGAGTPLRAVQSALERTGRRLPLDPPSPGATLGGVLAADEAGPLRLRHGTACEQLVGLRWLNADGELVGAGAAEATGGAPPVGLELGRLLCGSQGGLGVLVSATLRVQALPASRVWVSRPVWTPLEVHDLVRAVLAARLDPAAIELDLPTAGSRARRPVHPSRAAAMANHPSAAGRRRDPAAARGGAGTLAVLLEGGPAEVTERAERLVALVEGDATVAHSAPDWWRRYPFAPGDTALRVEVPIGDLHAAVYALRDAAGGPVPVRGSAGLGVVHAALPGSLPAERVGAILAAVRGVLLARRGRCVVLSAPPAVRQAVDVWGEAAVIPRLRAAKEHLDPHRRLAPGRLPGGL